MDHEESRFSIFSIYKILYLTNFCNVGAFFFHKEYQQTYYSKKTHHLQNQIEKTL
jgi:hypothetical protein